MSQNYKKQYNRSISPEMKVAMYIEERKELLDSYIAQIKMQHRNGGIKQKDKNTLDALILHFYDLLRPYILEEKKEEYYKNYKGEDNFPGLKILEKYELASDLNINIQDSAQGNINSNINMKPKNIPIQTAIKAYKVLNEAYYELGFSKLGNVSKSHDYR